MWLPDDLYTAAKHSDKVSFYCAYGHEMNFCQGENEETKLRRERDRLKQDAGRLNDELAAQRKRAEDAERVNRKLKTRAAAGVCPCCNRTFLNMQRHMRSKHPNVVPLEQANGA